MITAISAICIWSAPAGSYSIDSFTNNDMVWMDHNHTDTDIEIKNLIYPISIPGVLTDIIPTLADISRYKPIPIS